MSIPKDFQFSEAQMNVIDWALAHGFIAEPANASAKKTCQELAKLGLFVNRPADPAKRFDRYEFTERARKVIKEELGK